MVANPRLALFTAALPLLLSGCIARTAASIVTAPVRIVGSGVDMMTTSQSEADEKRGREIRKQEERLGRLYREYDRHSEQCRDGERRACEQARRDYAEIENLRGSVPAPRDD